MSLLAGKQDPFAGIQYNTKEMGVAPAPYSRPSNMNSNTTPQVYDLKATKLDWIYSGAYSLRFSGTENEAWSVKIHSGALEVYRADGTLVGTAKLHNWKTQVEVSMNNTKVSGSSFPMKRNKGFLSESKSFIVPETGEKLTWKRAGKISSKFELVDDAGHVVACIGATSWKGKYKFEVVRAGMAESVLEVVLVTALATAENEKRNTGAAVVAGSS
jgi:hypothetical protein